MKTKGADRSKPSQQPTAMASSARGMLSEIVGEIRWLIAGLFAISGTVNVLALTGSFFMLQVYDRVLPGRSVPTLIGFGVLVIGLYAFQGILDAVRGRILVRVAFYVDERLGSQAYQLTAQMPLLSQTGQDGAQPIRDLDQIRTFISGPGPLAFFDLPWLPVYLAVCFLFHPWLGIVASGGALVLIILTGLIEFLTYEPASTALANASARNVLADASRSSAEALRAMGFAHHVERKWAEAGNRYLNAQGRLSDLVGSFSALSRVLRMMLQSSVLATGALLVLQQQASAGIIIAGSIIAARALAPVDLAISNWKGFTNARQSLKRLSGFLERLPQADQGIAMPSPKNTVDVSNLALVPPGNRQPTVANVSFKLRAGQGLGIVGPSASGKSSLVRGLVGIWPPARGSVRLDGATLDRWTPAELGPNIGYLPQSTDLIGGTIAENIARFDPDATAKDIIAAAELAGIHEMVLKLPDGYDTDIGERGTALSAGQRQRVALARALFGDPFLVVLDEPNSNLDADGDAALNKALVSVRRRGGIAIVVAHRPSALAALDQVLVMRNGQMQTFGPKEEVLEKVVPGGGQRLTRRSAAAEQSVQVEEEQQ